MKAVIHRIWQHRRKKKIKAKTQHNMDTPVRKQTQITYVRHETSYKQLWVKTNRISFSYGNRNGHDNTKVTEYL
jgi:hypothetical protein